MSFDVNNNFVTPVIFSSQDELTAAKLDLVVDEVATALTTLKTGLQNVSATGSTTVAISGVTGLQAALNGKQPTLSGTPLYTTALGTTVAPLTNGKIDAAYLPDSSSTSSSGVDTFNGRSGAVSLSLADVTTALNFTPAAQSHIHEISDITGLTGVLAGKQDALGYIPANATHTHAIADVTGLQTALDGKVEVSSSTSALEAVFPIGHTIAATASGVLKNQSATLYTGTGTDASYTTTATGTILTGVWLCRGAVSGTAALYQRVS